MPHPILSVIMPVYNSGSYVRGSILSILDQTFDNLELIVINDGSTDNSLIEMQSVKDKRLKLYQNDRNRGIVYTRNKGLKLARGKYIGMLDADDIAYPEKFAKQIAFLEQHLDFGMVGSWARFIDEEGEPLPGGWKLTASSEMIPSIMLFKNYFLQSAVVYRKECIDQFVFREGFDILEDYLIWLEILKGYKAWNLQEYLVDYRVHQESVTKKHKAEKREKEKQVFRMQLNELGIDASDFELELHLMIRDNNPVNEINILKSTEKWLLKIHQQNTELKVYDQKMLTKVIFGRWLKVCYKASHLHFKMLHCLVTSKLLYIFIKNSVT